MKEASVSKTFRITLSLVVPLLLLGTWGALGDPSSPVAPPPQTWLASAAALWAAGDYQVAVVATLQTVLWTTVAAGLVGTVVGAVLGARPALSEAVSPTLEFLRALPPPTLVPVGMLLIGSGPALAAVVVSLAALWPVLLNVLQAVRAIHPTLIHAGRSLCLTRRSMLLNIYLPSIAPAVVTGLRVAAPLAIIVTLLVEMLATRPGVGRLLLSAQRDFDAPAVLALLLTIGLLGAAVNAAFAWLEHSVTTPSARR
jgi:ABC-type nitrate/sulfonate/bicarbonate transport system permease component